MISPVRKDNGKGKKWLFFLFLNLLFGSNLTNINIGYKLSQTDIIKNLNLQSDGFEFCEEVIAKILKSGYPIKEVPIYYYPRKFSQGKKSFFWMASLLFDNY